MKTHCISRIYHKSKLLQKVPVFFPETTWQSMAKTESVLRGFIPSVYNSDSPVSYNAIVLCVVSVYGGVGLPTCLPPQLRSQGFLNS